MQANHLTEGQGLSAHALTLTRRLGLGWGLHEAELSTGIPTVQSFISSSQTLTLSFFLVTPLLAWLSSCILHMLVLWVFLSTSDKNRTTSNPKGYLLAFGTEKSMN